MQGDPFVAPDKEKVKDYTLLMLGVPVVKVELDDQQIDFAYNSTLELFNEIARGKGLASISDLGVNAINAFQSIALAKATIMLGRIRSKWNPVPGPEGDIHMDGSALVEEGKCDLNYWTNVLHNL